jgi:GDP-L-fucose synthase
VTKGIDNDYSITAVAEVHSAEECSFFSGKKVWITGCRGMLGSALVRRLRKSGADLLLPGKSDLNLTNQAAVQAWMEHHRPQIVFHAAAMVGGIYANSTLPADFLYNNLAIEANVINAAKLTRVEKLIFVASNCIYPVDATQPIHERSILSGPLEENIRFYGISKIAGIELCRAYRKQYDCNFISVIPPNLYGPGDSYHQTHAHVVAGILRRSHEAKVLGNSEVVVWGDGTARRELLYVDDLADAMAFLMATNTEDDVFNVGCGHDFAIAELAGMISEAVGFAGKVVYDTTKPNGTMRKLLDSSRILSLGWKPTVTERIGLKNAYLDFLGRVQKV